MLAPFVAAVLAAGASSALAAPAAAPAVLQTYTTGAGTKWTYSNCQSDLAYGTRALPIGLSTSARTVEACLNACTNAGYQLCGIEYHGECWGGNALDKTSTVQPETACDLTCWDNPLQVCGGVGGETKATMNLYKRAAAPTTTTTTTATTTTSSTTTTTTTTTTTSSSSAAPTPTATKYSDPSWSYKGCYTDLVNGARSLPNALSAANWSAPACLTAAKAAGYSVAGVTYGGECWAGNSLSTAAVKKNDTTCDFACSDARGLTCGGDKLLDVYTTTTPPLATVPKNQTTFGNWQYDNCYSDRIDLRSLPISLDNPKGNIQGCLDACTAINATLCGLEWYGECFASTSGFQHLAAPIDQSKCSTPCRSDSSQICGGNEALSVYKFVPGPPPCVPVQETAQTGRYAKNFYNYVGCYKDATNSAGIGSLFPRLDSASTQEECFTLVMNKAATFAGLRGSVGCYAGNNTLPASAQLVDSSNCNLRATSNSNQLWGGGEYTAVYKLSCGATTTPEVASPAP
ncbi:hypothetical protein JCM6882_000426 [Rhodosporidiobolus microsporus]